jgi:heme oxygenase (biliverdin-IX-beta and delta-forming)
VSPCVTERSAIALSTLGQRLREETAQVHRQVEGQLSLLDPELTTARVTEAIRALYGFWVGNELGIDRWFADHRAAAASLAWPGRRRTHLFARDLTSLGVRASTHLLVPRAPPVFPTVGEAQVFGWLYVAEGSTLGGAVIARHLQKSGLDAFRLRGLNPYAEGPGPMWRSFGLELEGWASQRRDRADAISAAAVTTFESLSEWLAVLAVPVSA